MPICKDTSPYLILGLGHTGFSCARYLSRQGLPFSIMDTRVNPPYLEVFRQAFPHIPLYLNNLDLAIIRSMKKIIISPGLDLSCLNGIGSRSICGDIELFAQTAQAPIIAITGTNGKGTVTSLVGNMLARAGKLAEVGGNIGKPALDLLIAPTPDFYVLELSSFQLETTYSLAPQIAVLLNITSDHLDRHKTLTSYQAIKQRVYSNCQLAIWNRDDMATYPKQPNSFNQLLSFGLDKPESKQLGLMEIDGCFYLAQGQKPLFCTQNLKIHGKHNWANALAALAVGCTLDLPLPAMQEALQEFTGLPHRCQLVTKHQGVYWYNDSKATNVGASCAAIKSLGTSLTGRLVLIAGGISKGMDFSPLFEPIQNYVKKLILIGKDAALLKKVLWGSTSIVEAQNLETAVCIAKNLVNPGDGVLLSPGCASMDMFENYEDRGQKFSQLVNQLD